MERVAIFLLEMDRRLAKTGMIALPMCRRDIGVSRSDAQDRLAGALRAQNQGILLLSNARHIALRNRQRLIALEA